jgi:hypothetical protein
MSQKGKKLSKSDSLINFSDAFSDLQQLTEF